MENNQIKMLYTNYRGETSLRRIGALCEPKVKTSEWHPEPQLILKAFDLDKKQWRDFALRDCNFTVSQTEINR
jgi:hypothetical protein